MNKSSRIKVVLGMLLFAGYINAQMLSSKDVLDIKAELIGADPPVIENSMQ